MLLSHSKNGLTSLFKEVRVFKVGRNSLVLFGHGFVLWMVLISVDSSERIGPCVLFCITCRNILH